MVCCQTHRFPREWALRTRAKIGSPSLEEKYQESEAHVDFAHATKSRRRPAYCSYVKERNRCLQCYCVFCLASWTVYRTESCQSYAQPSHHCCLEQLFVVMIHCQPPPPLVPLSNDIDKGCWRIEHHVDWARCRVHTYHRSASRSRLERVQTRRRAWPGQCLGTLQICSH